MRTCVCLSAAAAVLLLVLSGPAFAGGAGPVSTYGGSFSLRIPADAAATRGWMQDAVVYVPDHLLISDLNVLVDIRHTAAFDLQLFLEGPSGHIVLLNASNPQSGYYEGGDYSGTTFDDEAAVGIEDAIVPFAGSFRPLHALAAFDGGDAYGPWALQVYDAYYNDTGWLDSFALIITTSLPEEPSAVPAPAASVLALLGMALVGPLKTVRRPSRGRPAPASS